MTKNEMQNFKKFYQIMNSNNDTFIQKIKVIKLNKSDGKEKTDKDGNPVINQATGEVEKWDDSYYLTFLAMNSGGTHSTRISQEQFITLKEEFVYVATGKIEYVSYKDNYNTVPTVKFESFEDFENYLVSQLEITTSQQEKSISVAEVKNTTSTKAP